MSKQFKARNKGKNGPDADLEFVFCSRSLCLEEKTDSGLSAITDHHFGPIESYRNAEALPPVPPDVKPLFPPVGRQDERSPSPSPRDGVNETNQNPPLPTRQASSLRSKGDGSQRSLDRQQNINNPQSTRSLVNSSSTQSKRSLRSNTSGSTNNNCSKDISSCVFVEAAVEDKDSHPQSKRSLQSYSSSFSNNNRSNNNISYVFENASVEDEDDVYMDEFLPERSEATLATQKLFVARVSSTNDELEDMEQQKQQQQQEEEEDDGIQSLVGSKLHSTRNSSSATHPEKSFAEQEIASNRRRRYKIVLGVLACLCLFLFVAMVVLVVWVIVKEEDDDPASKGSSGAIASSGGAPSTSAPSTTIPISTTSTQPYTTQPYTTQPYTTQSYTTTAPAPVVQRNFSLSGGPFASADARFGTNPWFGYALALVGDFLAVGEPNVQRLALGDIVIRQRSNNWELRDTGFNVTGTRRFGYSMDGSMVGGTTASIVVGASETRDDGGLSSTGAGFGSAHVYQLDSSGVWNAVGNEMRPAMLLQESGGKFGSAVAMATDMLRVAVGAPDSSVSLESLKTGRVYAYEFDGTDWQPMGNPLVGAEAWDRIGASVAMSRDGSRMLVGSPGDHNGAGAVGYYEWNPSSSEWKSIFKLRGQDNSNEALGTTVAILSADGRRIAFGAPTWGNNQGRIEIFEESTIYEGFFAKIGDEDIVGNDGERVGTTLCGAKGMVAFGTENGSFRLYEMDSSKNAWTKVADGPSLGSPVISMDMTENASSIAVGLDSEQVHVYDLNNE